MNEERDPSRLRPPRFRRFQRFEGLIFDEDVNLSQASRAVMNRTLSDSRIFAPDATPGDAPFCKER